MNAISPIMQQMRGSLEQTANETEMRNLSGQVRTGKELASAMRDSMADRNTVEATTGQDTVTISEEGRTAAALMQEKKEQGPDGETFPGGGKSVKANLAGGEEGMSAAERARETIIKQIKQVKEKIEEAKQRLAEASASGKESTPSGNAGDAAAQAVQGMGGTTEAEAIQAEIKMLEQQLQTLNQQLMESDKASGGAPAMGSAGIGGMGESGGKGERIAVG